ncbi:MAG: hypothetical protein HKO53_03315 [Gemmatimonadetes bacterium]|nr:hypothetical protein [Gemmatimonadota bacterium]
MRTRGWTLVLISALAACGAADAAEQPDGIEQAVRACELLSLADATRIIGPGTEHPGGDTEEWTCIYSNPGVALLTVQLGPAASYDEIMIPQPHAALDVGARGRYNTQDNGVAAVQFVSGDYAVTLGARPIGSTDTDLLDPLMAAAREIASALQ